MHSMNTHVMSFGILCGQCGDKLRLFGPHVNQMAYQMVEIRFLTVILALKSFFLILKKSKEKPTNTNE